MTALPRRLQITKNGIGDRSPKMRSVIALVHVVTSDQRSLLSMSSPAISKQQQAQKKLDVAIWGSSADVLIPIIAR